MSEPLLEVIVQSAADARAARDGGADRVELVSRLDADGLTPDVSTLRETLGTGVSTRVMLRPSDVVTVTGADRAALLAQAVELAATDVPAFVVGYVDAAGRLDEALLAELAGLLSRPFTLHRAFDRVADARGAYAVARRLDGCDTILTGGGGSGIGAGGIDSLVAQADWPSSGGPGWLAGGGLDGVHIAPLWAAGVRQFHIGTTARASRMAPVEAGRVRAVRDLIDSSARS